jgi:hypothetical protein
MGVMVANTIVTAYLRLHVLKKFNDHPTVHHSHGKFSTLALSILAFTITTKQDTNFPAPELPVRHDLQ